MNKLFCVEYFLSVTMGVCLLSQSSQKTAWCCGCPSVHQSASDKRENVTPILSLESLMQRINCVETLFMTFK